MKQNNIYYQLKNDIIHSKYPDAYYLNQTNDINKINTGQKAVREWKYFIDGYQISVNNNNFFGNYRYDKVMDRAKPMTFGSFSKQSGLDFLNFINSIINGDESIFLLTKGLEVFDLRKSLFKVQELQIRNTEVDNFCISMITRYLPKLNRITFIHCTLKKECDFSKVRTDINFNESIIKDFRIFNNASSNIEFLRTHIEKITNTTVNSKTIKFESITELDYKTLFLKCDFKELKTLIISPEADKVGFSYRNDFMFLPKSAPNLENLSIMGKLENFDFLTQLKILRCSIDSVYDRLGSFYPDVITKKERERLKKRNLKRYEIKKILMPEEGDKLIIGQLELERILRLAHFNNLISYTDDEKFFLLKNPNLLKYLLSQKKEDGEITKFYESYYDKLISRNTENEQDVRLGLTNTYKMVNGIMCICYNREVYSNHKKIILTKKFIYNYDDKPIIFMNRFKSINEIQEAIDFRKKYKATVSTNEEDFNNVHYNEFIKWFKDFQKENEEITIGSLMSVWEEFGCTIDIQNFKKLGEGGRFIAGIMEKCYRLNKASDTLYAKILYYKELIKKLLTDNYHKFTTKEKIVLVVDEEKYDIRVNPFAIESDIFEIKKDYDESLIKDIDYKTNHLYSKYMSLLKLIYNQVKMRESGYDIPIKVEYIKNVKFDDNQDISNELIKERERSKSSYKVKS